MYQIRYDIDYSTLFEFVNEVRDKISDPNSLPETVQAVQASLNYATAEWIRTAESKFKH
jgi:hypothetical protein